MTADDPTPWLEQAVAAIDAAETGPTPENLAAAPILTPWHPLLTLGAAPILWGHVSGHPILGTTRITTSRLIALDPGDRWARTLNRWYRLGRRVGRAPADPAAAERQASPRGDAARLAVDAARLGCLPVSDQSLLDQLMASFRTQVRAHQQQAAARHQTRH